MVRKSKPPTGLERAIMDAIADSGMNQLELSAASGVDQGTISHFLDPDPDMRHTVTLPVADKLCNVLGLELVPKAKKRKGR